MLSLCKQPLKQMGQTIKLQRGFRESHGLTTPGRSVSWHLKYFFFFFLSFELQGLEMRALVEACRAIPGRDAERHIVRKEYFLCGTRRSK